MTYEEMLKTLVETEKEEDRLAICEANMSEFNNDNEVKKKISVLEAKVVEQEKALIEKDKKYIDRFFNNEEQPNDKENEPETPPVSLMSLGLTPKKRG